MMILICSSPLIAAKVTIAWLQRCLRKASTPPEILAIVESFLINMPVLILDGVEFAPLELASGLTQGCPASCMLHIIGVDPLLSSLQQTPHISGVSGFVDDWSMGCHGLSAISEVSNVIHDFEQASGKQINRGKSALIPARQLSDDERASCLAIWNSDIRISSRERVLGLFIGIHVSIHDQYYNAVHKFDVALTVFDRVKMSLSLAMSVLVVNIFMFSLFSYPNRQFFMPRVLLQEIDFRFLTPITWAKLGMFSAVGALYGTQLFLQDLRLSNVASALSTHEAWSDISRGTISALGRWRRRHTFLPNLAISWKVAFDFFRHTVGTTHSEILSDAGYRRPKRLFRLLYQRLAGVEFHRTTSAQECASTSQMVPVDITSARLVAAHVIEAPVQCCFCSGSSDSLDHLPRCLTVLDVYNSIRDTANLPPIIDGRHSLMLQERWEGSVLAGLLAFFFAIWTVRSMHRRGVHFLSFFELRDLVLVSLQCPLLLRCCPTRSHKQRRQDRVCPIADTRSHNLQI